MPEAQNATMANPKSASATSNVNPLLGTNVGFPLVSGMTVTDSNFPPNAQNICNADKKNRMEPEIKPKIFSIRIFLSKTLGLSSNLTIRIKARRDLVSEKI